MEISRMDFPIAYVSVMFGLAVWGIRDICSFGGYVDRFSCDHVRDAVTAILFFGAGVIRWKLPLIVSALRILYFQ